MNYIEKEMLNCVFDKYAQDIVRIEIDGFHEAIKYGGYIYLSCYVKTHGRLDYTVIYDSYDGGYTKTKEEAMKDSYWSDFNKGYAGKLSQDGIWYTKCPDYDADIIHEGIGASLLVLHENDLSVHKIFYFKDAYNINSVVEFIDIVDQKVIVNPDEYCYVFSQGEYINLHFVNSWKHLEFGDKWILYPHYGYDAVCMWQIIDFREKEIFNIPFDYIPDENENLEIFFNFRNCSICFDFSSKIVEIPFSNIFKEENKII